MLIGWLLYHYPPNVKMRICLYILGIAGLLIKCIGTYQLSMNAGKLIEMYTGYLNLTTVLYSMAMMLFLKKAGDHLVKRTRIKKIVMFLGSYTFPLYLLHYFAIVLIKDLTKADTKSIGYLVLTPMGVLMMVIAFTWIVRKIPLLRKSLP